MNLIIPDRITRQFIQSNRAYNFIYGDSLDRAGDGGQAKEARGEPNALMLPVKYRKCYNDEAAFTTDLLYWYNLGLFSKSLDDSLLLLVKPMIVFPKIGLGRNEMDKRAPYTYRALISMLKECPLVINKEMLPTI